MNLSLASDSDSELSKQPLRKLNKNLFARTGRQGRLKSPLGSKWFCLFKAAVEQNNFQLKAVVEVELIVLKILVLRERWQRKLN